MDALPEVEGEPTNQDVVARNIPEEHAADRLIELIDEHGQWIDRPS